MGWAGPLAIAAVLSLAPVGEAPMTRHATGTFEVTMTPEAQGPAPEDGLPTARMALAKTFTGGLNGRTTGTMLSAGTPAPGQPAAYVAIDQFQGRVDGREGGFVLLHRGTISGSGASELSIIIAPDSGTRALRGIAGTLDIRIEGGVHRYDLAYTLPAGDGAAR